MQDDTLSDLKLALTEACSNSVRHAYAAGTPGAVDVDYELGDGYLAVQIEDEGPGFDPDSSGRRSTRDARRGRSRARDHPGGLGRMRSAVPGATGEARASASSVVCRSFVPESKGGCLTVFGNCGSGEHPPTGQMEEDA